MTAFEGSCPTPYDLLLLRETEQVGRPVADPAEEHVAVLLLGKAVDSLPDVGQAVPVGGVVPDDNRHQVLLPVDSAANSLAPPILGDADALGLDAPVHLKPSGGHGVHHLLPGQLVDVGLVLGLVPDLAADQAVVGAVPAADDAAVGQDGHVLLGGQGGGAGGLAGHGSPPLD